MFADNVAGLLLHGLAEAGVVSELPINQVVCGDCREVLKGFPSNSIDLVVTSPPYWALRDYGEETASIWGGDPECEHEFNLMEPPSRGNRDEGFNERWGNSPGQRKQEKKNELKSSIGFCVKCGAWLGQLGLEPHPQMYIDHLIEICHEIKRVLKPSGSFWLNLGDTYYNNPSNTHSSQVSARGLNNEQRRRRIKYKSNWLQPKQLLGIPWRVAIALQEDGWILRNCVIWHKTSHMPESVRDRLTKSYEFFFFVKKRKYFFDLDSIRVPHKRDWSLAGGSLSPSKTRSSGTGWASKAGRNDDNRAKPPQMNPLGKNPGDVWSIPTEPFPGAHFAVYPTRLIKPIIKAGCPEWVCSKCGRPRKRITRVAFKSHYGGPRKRADAPGAEVNPGSVFRTGEIKHRATVGWTDCGCGEGWEPGIVLDPFAGSGTTLRVARSLGRRFIGIEINPEYAEMCRRRVKTSDYLEAPDEVVSLTEFLGDDSGV